MQNANMYYPVWLDLTGVPVLVVGAGKVALRKVCSLLPCKPAITLISPEILPELESLGNKGFLSLQKKTFESKDVEGQRLVFACTNSPALNQEIVTICNQQGIWVSDASHSHGADVLPGAALRRGSLAFSVSSGGKAPILAKTLRNCLANLFGHEWAKLSKDIIDSRQPPLSDTDKARIDQQVRNLFTRAVRMYLERIARASHG